MNKIIILYKNQKFKFECKLNKKNGKYCKPRNLPKESKIFIVDNLNIKKYNNLKLWLEGGSNEDDFKTPLPRKRIRNQNDTFNETLNETPKITFKTNHKYLPKRAIISKKRVICGISIDLFYYKSKEYNLLFTPDKTHVLTASKYEGPHHLYSKIIDNEYYIDYTFNENNILLNGNSIFNIDNEYPNTSIDVNLLLSLLITIYYSLRERLDHSINLINNHDMIIDSGHNKAPIIKIKHFYKIYDFIKKNYPDINCIYQLDDISFIDETFNNIKIYSENRLSLENDYNRYHHSGYRDRKYEDYYKNEKDSILYYKKFIINEYKTYYRLNIK
jgi:hypothetical protein